MAEESSAKRIKPNDAHADLRRQYVWLIRYGLTEHALVENVGPFDSDIDPTTGQEHADAIAKRIANSDDAVPVYVYSDEAMRTTHTADIIVKAIIASNGRGTDEKFHRIEEGVTEWLIPALLVTESSNVKTDYLTPKPLEERFPRNIDLNYKSVNPVEPDGSSRSQVPVGAPLFVETEKDLFLRINTTFTNILNDNSINGDENLCIVSHAPCLQAMALYFAGIEDPRKSSFGPWSLGGVTRFSRTVSAEKDPSGNRYGAWGLDFYSDTDHMPGTYKGGVKGSWSMPSFVK